MAFGVLLAFAAPAAARELRIEQFEARVAVAADGETRSPKPFRRASLAHRVRDVYLMAGIRCAPLLVAGGIIASSISGCRHRPS